jgi:hypothetical protein
MILERKKSGTDTKSGNCFIHRKITADNRGRPEIFKTSAGLLILAAPGGFFAFSGNGGENWETHPEIMRGLPHNADPNLLELADGRIICAYFFGSDWPFPPPVDEYIGCTVFNVRT